MGDLSHAQKWIHIAERDYAVAVTLNEVHRPLPIEVICFHCQQSVEKVLKAVLAYNNVDIPKTHDIRLLNKLCQKYTDKVNIDIRVAEEMTDYAVDARYVEDNRDFTQDTAKFAIKYAKQILDQVNQIVNISSQDG